MHAELLDSREASFLTFRLTDAPDVEAAEVRHRQKRTMRPDDITVSWSQGSLTGVTISGPRLNQDGEPGLFRCTVKWGTVRSQHVRSLAELPDWVREFAAKLID